MKRAVALAIALVAMACAAGPAAHPQAIDVRLDIVARSLARAAESAPDDPGAKRAVADAYSALWGAQRAIEAWRNGDPRPWARARPCLAASLDRVESALVACGALPPPGLTQTIGRSEESCPDGE